MERQVRRKRRRGRTNSQKKIILIGAIVLAAALIAFLTVYFVMKSAVNKVAADIIWDNIYIESVDVSGMNAQEAKEALDELTQKYETGKVELIAEEAAEKLTLKDLGFEMKDTESLVKKAVDYGKKGSVWSRYRQLQQLTKPKDKSQTNLIIQASYGIDAKATENLIAEKFAELKGAAVNATIKRENGQFVITDGKAGIKVDLKKSTKQISDYFSKDWTFKETEKFTLITTVDEPDVKTEDLQQIKDALGTFSTIFKHTNSRGKNIINATSRFNGLLLLPGETISASDTMGARTPANGYLEAGSYLNGEVVESYGGGICQVSTTLYNAAILAELEIVERSSHSMLVDYVEPSMDAAVAEGVLDLKIKNNSDVPIYIEAVTNGGKLSFTVYGKETRPSGRTVSYVSEVLSTSDPGAKFITTGDAVGYMKKEVSVHMGMKAKLWKVVTENGTEVSREQFNKSSYKASPAVYHVGIGGDNAEASAIVKNAISSKNEDTIRAAIAQAQAVIAAAQAPVQPEEPETPPATP